MNEIRTACQDRQAGRSAVRCYSQGHNRIARLGFEPRACRSQSRRFYPLDHAADNHFGLNPNLPSL